MRQALEKTATSHYLGYSGDISGAQYCFASLIAGQDGCHQGLSYTPFEA